MVHLMEDGSSVKSSALSNFFSLSLFVCCDLPLLLPEGFAAIELPTFRDTSWRNDSVFAIYNTFHLYATVRVSSDLRLFVQDLSVTYFGRFYFCSVVFECVGGRAGSADSP